MKVKLKNLCFVTSSRADFDLLFHTLERIENSKIFNLQLIVTGSHLFKRHGETINQIRDSGFNIDQIVKLKDESTTEGVINNMSIALKSFSKAYSTLNPDMVVVLGDRFEIFSSALASFINNIPIAHIHGGEVTLSAQDDAMRHGITKMSSLHFVSHLKYKKRVIQLGEKPSSVHVVGPLGAERIRKLEKYTREEAEEILKYKFLDKNVLVTYHPETLKKGENRKNFREILNALQRFKDIGVIFTSPNIDAESDKIRSMINSFVKKNNNRSIHYESMGDKLYFSTMINVDCVLGNSSSGIIEAPILRTPTINIGDRQSGRVQENSIINIKPEKADVINAINLIFSSKFKAKILRMKTSTKNNDASSKIYKKLSSLDFEKKLLKGFYDL